MSCKKYLQQDLFFRPVQYFLRIINSPKDRLLALEICCKQKKNTPGGCSFLRQLADYTQPRNFITSATFLTEFM